MNISILYALFVAYELIMYYTVPNIDFNSMIWGAITGLVAILIATAIAIYLSQNSETGVLILFLGLHFNLLLGISVAINLGFATIGFNLGMAIWQTVYNYYGSMNTLANIFLLFVALFHTIIGLIMILRTMS
jgi:hypothetical protein